MNTSLKEFDEKIEQLKKKKKEHIQKQANQLFKILSDELGPEFSPQMIAVMIKDTWQKATLDQKEEWKKTAGKFQMSPPRKTRKTTQTHPSAA